MNATCAECGTAFEAKRSTAKFCSTRCRVRDTRARAAASEGGAPAQSRQTPTPPAPQSSGDVPLLVAATLTELAEAGKLGSVLGQQAVRLAERMCGQADTGSAIASLSKELRATMAEVLKGASAAVDPLDEMKARRDRKRAG